LNSSGFSCASPSLPARASCFPGLTAAGAGCRAQKLCRKRRPMPRRCGSGNLNSLDKWIFRATAVCAAREEQTKARRPRRNHSPASAANHDETAARSGSVSGFADAVVSNGPLAITILDKAAFRPPRGWMFCCSPAAGLRAMVGRPDKVSGAAPSTRPISVPFIRNRVTPSTCSPARWTH